MMATEPREPDVAPAPPHNIEAECGLLGALMIDNRLVDRIADKLEPEHFFEPLHAASSRRSCANMALAGAPRRSR
jgi:replicative DNA helicase